MSLVPVDPSSQPVATTSDEKFIRLLSELTTLKEIYGTEISLFFDHGFGHLTISASSVYKGSLKIHVRRLSADLEQEEELFEISREKIPSVLWAVVLNSPDSLMHMKKEGSMSETRIDTKTSAISSKTANDNHFKTGQRK